MLAVCGFIVSLFFGSWQALAAGETTMSDVKAGFARAVGVAPKAVRNLRVLELPPGGKLAACWLGIVEKKDGPEGALVPVGLCKSGICPGKPLELPFASHLLDIAVIDLQKPFKIDLSKLPQSGSQVIRSSGQKGHSALLVRTRYKFESEGERDNIVLCSLEEKPRLLWEEETRSVGADGGGFESYELSFTPGSGGWPVISLLQTTVPGMGRQPFMPGPPLLLHYQYKGKSYRRVD